MTARWWHRRHVRPGSNGQHGFTFVELLVTTAIIMVLASMVLPLARVSVRRQRETRLRAALIEVRTAIDQFKMYADTNRLSSLEINANGENYPQSLQQLVDGVSAANDVTGKKYKFLRRIPIDPMTGKADWGMRSVNDPPTSMAWGGSNVFDIYTKAEGKALDGTKYKDW